MALNSTLCIWDHFPISNKLATLQVHIINKYQLTHRRRLRLGRFVRRIYGIELGNRGNTNRAEQSMRWGRWCLELWLRQWLRQPSLMDGKTPKQSMDWRENNSMGRFDWLSKGPRNLKRTWRKLFPEGSHILWCSPIMEYQTWSEINKKRIILQVN